LLTGDKDNYNHSEIEAKCPERERNMFSRSITSSLAHFSRRLARIFGYRIDHRAEVITGFPPHAFR